MATVRHIRDVKVDRTLLSRFGLATHSQLRLRELPVGATAIRRKLVIWPWIAIISAVLLVMIKAGAAGARGSRGGPEAAIGLAVLAGAVVLLGRWIFTIRPARRRIQQSRAPFAYEVLADDKRLPIVVLRSFRSESEVTSGVPPFRQRIEEVIVSTVRPYGPVIAIGAPEDELPELGAARAYVPGDNEWTKVALEWIRSARMIVMIAGETPGLAWELERIIEHGQVHKLLVVCPRPRIFGPTVPREARAPFRFAQRINRAIGSAQPLMAEDLDGVIAMFPGNEGVVLLRDDGNVARSYRLAVETAILELFCRGREAELGRAAGQGA